MILLTIDWETDKLLTMFWGYVKSLLGFTSPWVMISVAIFSVGLLLTIIISAWVKASKDKDDEDEDFEVKHY